MRWGGRDLKRFKGWHASLHTNAYSQIDRQTPNPYHVVDVCVDEFGEWRRCGGASKVMMMC